MTPSFSGRIRVCLFSFDQGFGEYRNESFKDVFLFYLTLLFAFSVFLTALIATGLVVFGPEMGIPNAAFPFIIRGVFLLSLVGASSHCSSVPPSPPTGEWSSGSLISTNSMAYQNRGPFSLYSPRLWSLWCSIICLSLCCYLVQ